MAYSSRQKCRSFSQGLVRSFLLFVSNGRTHAPPGKYHFRIWAFSGRKWGLRAIEVMVITAHRRAHSIGSDEGELHGEEAWPAITKQE